MLIGLYILFFLATSLALALWRQRELLQVTYLEGKKAGLKQAVEAAKERGDVAVMMAPPGMLVDGLARAQTAHQIEMDLRTLLHEAR